MQEIDGDTIRVGRIVYRLVGFDTPEVGSGAGCERERTLAAHATRRLRELVAGGGHRTYGDPAKIAWLRAIAG